MRHFTALLFGLIALVMFGLSPASADAPDNSVEWKVGDTLFVAGRDITLARKLDGALTVTGETVTLTDESAVPNDVWIAARRVAVEGDIGGDIALRTPDALLNGHVKGNVSFYGMRLAFGPDARIDGNVTYYSSVPAAMDAGAVIKGKIEAHAYDDKADTSYHPRVIERDEGWHAPGYGVSIAGAIFFGLIAAFIALISPQASSRLRGAMGGHLVLAFVIGLGWLLATPVVAVISALTIVGIPLALIIVLLWPLGMLAGIVATILALSDLLAGLMTVGEEGRLRRLIAVAVSTVIVLMALSLPALGVLAWIAVVALGIGATALSFKRQISA